MKYQFTPHARGSTAAPIVKSQYTVVYPACAGIDLDSNGYYDGWIGLPRMRGDRPCRFARTLSFLAFTPHARGSTRGRVHGHRGLRVYPACAGIDLNLANLSTSLTRLPRMRGDRPRI